MKNIVVVGSITSILLMTSISSKGDTEQVPSFNCKMAKSSVEQIICNYPPLVYLDNRMAFYYQIAKANLPADQQQGLLNEQRKWLDNRNEVCNIPQKINFTNQSYGNLTNCLSDDYKKRNYALFIKTYNLENEPAIGVVTGTIDFGPFSVSGPISKKEIQELYKTEIISGGYHGIGEAHAIYNCNDLNKYTVDPENTPDMADVSTMSATCDVLGQLLKVKQPKNDNVTGVQISDIQYIPFSFLPSLTDDDDDLINSYEKQGLTVKDLAKHGLVTFKINSPTSITIGFNDSTAYIDEIARGDFLGDGNNSILILIYDHSGGTMSYTQLGIITRSDAKALFHFVWQTSE